MYKITNNGNTVGYSETVVYIKLADNGCYVPCDEEEAESVCVKLPANIEDDEGNFVTQITDVIFDINEENPQIERVNGSLVISEAEKIANILLGSEYE